MLKNISRKWKNRIFEVLFWAAILVGVALTVATIVLGWWVYKGALNPGEVGIALATGALALFTCFLWLAAAITARFARAEISTSTAVNSADLTLQLDNRFHNDRALRIRHGAVMFLAEKRGVPIDGDHDISPYSTFQSS